MAYQIFRNSVLFVKGLKMMVLDSCISACVYLGNFVVLNWRKPNMSSLTSSLFFLTFSMCHVDKCIRTEDHEALPHSRICSTIQTWKNSIPFKHLERKT